MKEVFLRLKQYRREAVLGPLFKLFEAGLELLVPLLVAALIDRGVALGDTAYILRTGLEMAALGLLGLFASVTAQYFAAKAAVGTAAQLRRDLFAQIQRFSYADLDRLGISTLLTRLTGDVEQVQSGLNLSLRLLLRSPFVVFGAMIMAFTVDSKAALCFAAVIPVLGIVVAVIMLTTIPLYRKAQEKLDRVLGQTRENLNGVRVLRAFRKESSEQEEYARRTKALYDQQLRVGRVSALLNPLTFVIINLAVAALIRVGALRVDGGHLSQGDVIALYNYMSQILVELIKLANLILSITRSAAGAQRIAAVLQVQPSQDSPEELPELDEQAPAVEFDRVSLRYPGASADALEDISFRVWPGQTVGVIGGTGSGKTSLVQLIGRFYDASEGSVRVHGADVRRWPLDALRRRLGLVPQRARLFAGTILENLLWGEETAPIDAIGDALDAAQALEIVESKDGGLDFPVEPDGRNLSGGQRQRLTIARALVRKPEILILDDSASALDLATDAALRKALQALSQKPTVFVVSQRTASIRHADKILVLDDGKLVGQGSHQELLRSCPVYREIHHSQYGEDADDAK